MNVFELSGKKDAKDHAIAYLATHLNLNGCFQ
jgi:hypothetical protein